MGAAGHLGGTGEMGQREGNQTVEKQTLPLIASVVSSEKNTERALRVIAAQVAGQRCWLSLAVDSWVVFERQRCMESGGGTWGGRGSRVKMVRRRLRAPASQPRVEQARRVRRSRRARALSQRAGRGVGRAVRLRHEENELKSRDGVSALHREEDARECVVARDVLVVGEAIESNVFIAGITTNPPG
jgi:hypothetical protein